MSSKIGEWVQASIPYPTNTPAKGAIGFTSTTTTEVTSIGISQYDTDGVLQKDWLESINVDSLIDLQGIMVGSNALSTWTIRVSGEPTVYTSNSGYYNFPVGSVSATQSGFNVGVGGSITLLGPTYGGSLSFNLDSDNVTISEESTLSGVTSRSEQWNTREGDIRKKMYRMTQAENNISFIYKELLRSMIASFSELGYISSEEKFIKIKCVHANAERTIAKLKQDNNIILPIVSISQTISNNNKNRRRAENVLVQEKYWDEEKNRAFRVLSFAPRAVDIMYQLNIWTKYMSDMDQILEQVRLKFNPDMEVPTKYSTLVKAYIDTEEDSGKLTAEDKEDRIIQKTINIVVEAYIPSPKFLVTSSGKIEKFLIGC